jgi:hypothetical protein
MLRLAAKACVLTERDHDILTSVYQYRYLTTSQLRRLHFPSAQTATRRLRILRQAGYLTSLHATGIDEQIETLSHLGLTVVADVLSTPVEELEWPAMVSVSQDSAFLKYACTLTDIQMALTTACATENTYPQLLAFQAPRLLGRTVRDSTGRSRGRTALGSGSAPSPPIHIPDAILALRVDAQTLRFFFLEIDRGLSVHLDAPYSLNRLIRDYYHLLKCGGIEEYAEDLGIPLPYDLRVLLVTRSRERLRTLRAQADNISGIPIAHSLFWLAVQVDLQVNPILETLWASLDQTDARGYSLSGPVVIAGTKEG